MPIHPLTALRAVLALALAATGAAAFAQTYPTKAIRYVVPFAAGGGVDTLARIVGGKLNAAWNVPVIIENRAGAGGNIGTEFVAKAPPDGYTLLMNPNSHAYNASLYAKPPYDPIKDFAAVGLVATSPFLLVVHPSVPVKSVKELIALARSRPKELTYSSGGTGGGSHLAGELFNVLAKTELVHVAYKGIAPAVTDLVGGHVSLAFSVVPPAIGHVKSGRLRPLGVSSAQRFALLPETPTIAEAGVPGYEAISWYATFAPAGTPQAIIGRLNAEIAKSVRAPDAVEKLSALGLEGKTGTPEEFLQYMIKDWKIWDKLIRDLAIRAG
jgi:tripartite-type tricarboxylate transporter receptor subunit TctC